MKKTCTALALLFGLGACSNGGDDPANTPPSVGAGPDQVVVEGTQVQLQGVLIDLEGDANLTWSQVSGPPISLSSTTVLDPRFAAPNVNDTLALVLRLTASDGVNTTSSSDVTITINDTPRDAESPQGIPNDGDRRRDDNRNRRDGDRPDEDGREVRRLDGTNNNLTHTDWGGAFEHLQRLAPVDYADGISSMAGATRPSARIVSNALVDQPEGTSLPNSFNGTDFVWQWGQFIDHDLDLTDGANESEDIQIPSGDPDFDPSGSGTVVIPFNRALFDPNSGTDVSNPREQENEITSWIDGSMVYGSDTDRKTALREAGTPFLKTSTGDLLPFNTDGLSNANGFVTDATSLFLAGDVRANEQVGLATMHTLFVREHNRLATRFLDDDPNEDIEDVYERARRLVIAKIQKITYDEWLPVLLGPNAIAPYSGYDDTVNPTIFNEFSVAAFRLGHSMLNTQLLRLDASGLEVAEGHLDLAEAFFTAPDVLTSETSLDPILRGLATQAHQSLDTKIVDDVRNFLFGQPGAGGLDLASLNIQRGRDHGVPSYNDVRAAMSLPRVTLFSEITSDSDLADALFDTYGSVDEIDLWVGGLAEDPIGNSQLGALFQAIMVKQFTDLRDGDRFWYERDLTSDERDRVRNSSLAEIIRDNTDIGSELQDDVFITP